MYLPSAHMLTDIGLRHDWIYATDNGQPPPYATLVDTCQACGLQRHFLVVNDHQAERYMVWFSRLGLRLSACDVVHLDCVSLPDAVPFERRSQ